MAYRGFSKALEIAKQYKLDIIHTQTEFSLGLLGIAIARELRIPVVHTYHTQYEDYVRYTLINSTAITCVQSWTSKLPISGASPTIPALS